MRRRLFEPMTDPTQFKDRDVVARAFADLYRTQAQEFPPECARRKSTRRRGHGPRQQEAPTHQGRRHRSDLHGTVALDPTRVGRDASHKWFPTSVAWSEVEIPAGAPDHVVRTVTKNSRSTLRFTRGLRRNRARRFQISTTLWCLAAKYIRRYKQQYGLPFPMLAGKDPQLLRHYEVNYVPIIVFIGKDGRIHRIFHHYILKKDFQSTVREIVEGDSD